LQTKLSHLYVILHTSLHVIQATFMTLHC